MVNTISEKWREWSDNFFFKIRRGNIAKGPVVGRERSMSESQLRVQASNGPPIRYMERENPLSQSSLLDSPALWTIHCSLEKFGIRRLHWYFQVVIFQKWLAPYCSAAALTANQAYCRHQLPAACCSTRRIKATFGLQGYQSGKYRNNMHRDKSYRYFIGWQLVN